MTISSYPSYFRIDGSRGEEVRSIEITLTQSSYSTTSDNNTEPVMYVSASLHDTLSQNKDTIGFSYVDPFSERFGQLERVSIPTQETTIYVGVTSGSDNANLKVSYFTKSANTAKKRSVGHPAAPPLVPWHVQLTYTLNDGSSSHFCSAALISKEWVVTAARCFPNSLQVKLKSGNEFSIRLGGLNVDERDLQIIPFGNEDLFVHEQYDSVTRKNDIALIHLREYASLSLAIQTIQLPGRENSNAIQGGLAATLSGWGSNNPSGELLEASVSVLAPARCKPFVEGLGAVYGDSVLCTEGMNSGSIDTGSPLYAQYKGLYFLLGVASYGGSTGTAAYASMSFFKSWIERNFDSPDKPGKFLSLYFA